MIALLSATLARFDEQPIVRAVIAIALIAAALLVLFTAWNLLRPYIKGTNAVRTGIIAAIVVVLVLMRVTPIRILLIAAVFGVVMASPAAPAVAEADAMSIIALYLLLLEGDGHIVRRHGIAAADPSGLRRHLWRDHRRAAQSGSRRSADRRRVRSARTLWRSATSPAAGPVSLAAWLAMVTPALLVIPLLTLLRRYLHLPRVRAAVDAVVIASAVLLLTSVVRMAMDAFDQLTRVFG